MRELWTIIPSNHGREMGALSGRGTGSTFGAGCFSLIANGPLPARGSWASAAKANVRCSAMHPRQWAPRHLRPRQNGNFDPFVDFDLIFGAAKQNLKIIETPICYKARIFGKTKISRFRDGWFLLKMVWFTYRKLRAI